MEKKMALRKWIHVDGLVKEITDIENTSPFNVDFNGECMMEITNIDGVWKVTNAMNGYGINCKKFWEDKEVVISVSEEIGEEITAKEYFDSQAVYNPWLRELTIEQRTHIIDMLTQFKWFVK